MAYSTVPKVLRDGKITLIDGTTPTAVELEVAYEQGDFSYDLPNDQSSSVIFDRGSLSAVRKNEDQFPTITFSADMRQFTDGSEAGSIIDFITKSGFYSGNLSTGSGSPYIEQYCISVKFEVEGTDHGDDADHEIVFAKCVPDSYSFAEGTPSRFTLSFTCYGGDTPGGPA